MIHKFLWITFLSTSYLFWLRFVLRVKGVNPVEKIDNDYNRIFVNFTKDQKGSIDS